MSRERPILFSAPMVRAILAGTKRQTRRLDGLHSINRDPDRSELLAFRDGVAVFGDRIPDDPCPIEVRCPYQVGQRRWIRETWGYRGGGWRNTRPGVEEIRIHYQADDSAITFDRPEGAIEALTRSQPKPGPGERQPYFEARLTRWWISWRPSIHMPRWASRLTLEITEVRVERLQDISEEDAKAEGCAGGNDSIPGYRFSATPKEHFQHLWDSINADRAPWASNPFVWVVGFRVAEARHG